MQDTIWYTLDLLMVVSLFRLYPNPRYTAFWVIQAAQLLEIPIYLMHPTWQCWCTLDRWVNPPLEALSLFLIVPLDLYLPMLLMFAHLMVKQVRWATLDCDYQYVHDTAERVIVWANNLLILSLLAYSLPNSILRAKELYARGTRWRAARRPADSEPTRSTEEETLTLCGLKGGPSVPAHLNSASLQPHQL